MSNISVAIGDAQNTVSEKEIDYKAVLSRFTLANVGNFTHYQKPKQNM